MKTCPRCKLINPPSAARCDCGYDFAAGKLKASYLDSTKIRDLVGQGRLDPVTAQKFQSMLDSGVRYVVFQYCISMFVMTLRRPSQVYEVGPEASRFRLGLQYSLISLFLGWWGIPWGPIWTISTIYNNCRGGKDITDAVVESSIRRAT